MAVINLSPDSFYHSLDHRDPSGVLNHAHRAVEEGAAIIDIGGMSTRPGSSEIPLEEEWNRLRDSIRLLKQEFGDDLILSIDTYRGDIAKRALDEGADMINDIGGGRFDPFIWEVVAEAGVPYVLMHNRAKPLVMKHHTDYSDLTGEVFDYFVHKIHLLRDKGIKDIVLDPGFGFAKTINQNFQLLKESGVFQQLNCPLLIGISRKSFLYKTLGVEPSEVLSANTALHFKALENGADILRVHDVKEAVQCINIFERYYSQ